MHRIGRLVFVGAGISRRELHTGFRARIVQIQTHKPVGDLDRREDRGARTSAGQANMGCDVPHEVGVGWPQAKLVVSHHRSQPAGSNRASIGSDVSQPLWGIDGQPDRHDQTCDCQSPGQSAQDNQTSQRQNAEWQYEDRSGPLGGQGQAGRHA